MKILKYLLVTAVLATAVLFFVPSVKAVTINELMAQIARLQEQLRQMQAEQNQGQAEWCHTFNANIGVGVKKGNPDVAALVTALKKEGLVDQNAMFTEGYDEHLASAIVEFQEKYASEILTPSNLKRGTGFMGKSTRAKLNKLYGCDRVTPNCQNLYWFDNEKGDCQASKQFCGAYMYYGLKTFPKQQECLTALRTARGNCTPNWTCQWGECKDGWQGKTPVDLNNCGIPATQSNIACTMEARACTSTPSITVTSPNGGEVWEKGKDKTIKWLSGGSDKVDIILHFQRNCSLTPCPSPSLTGESAGDVNAYIAKGVPNSGEFVWTVGKYTYGTQVMDGPDGLYKVQIKNNQLSDQSDNYFTITSGDFQ